MNEQQQSHRIFVIANAPDVRMTLRLILEEAGYEVREAQATEALCAVQEEAYGLAVVDLSRAQDGELDAVLTVKRMQPDMKVIAIGGGSPSVNRLFEDNPAGVARTLWKPFEFGDLVSTVREELRGTARGLTKSDSTGKGIVSALRRLSTGTRKFLQRDGENVQGRALAVALLFLGFVFSCATSPVTPAVRTHYIQIREQVSPPDLHVNTGDEVRWQNLRTDPVKVGLLSHHHLDLVSCEKGFKRFGTVDDTAMIPPRDYVSLCFSRPGTVQYNIWLNPADPHRSMVPTAKIQVSAVSPSRNESRNENDLIGSTRTHQAGAGRSRPSAPLSDHDWNGGRLRH